MMLAQGRAAAKLQRRRLARGMYCQPHDPPALRPSLVVLQRRVDGLHVGGKTALDW